MDAANTLFSPPIPYQAGHSNLVCVDDNNGNDEPQPKLDLIVTDLMSTLSSGLPQYPSMALPQASMLPTHKGAISQRNEEEEDVDSMKAELVRLRAQIQALENKNKRSKTGTVCITSYSIAHSAIPRYCLHELLTNNTVIPSFQQQCGIPSWNCCFGHLCNSNRRDS